MFRTGSLFALAALAPTFSWAQDNPDAHHLEEVLVMGVGTAAVTDRASYRDTLEGEALWRAAGNTLGQTLAGQLGVSTASFGTGVGQPVVRGQTGGRVAVLHNGLSTLDATDVSPDHASSVNPLVAERIEVLRGPQTLMYDGAAISVVNVIDNRIPEALPEALSGAADLRFDTAASAVSSTVKLESRAGDFGWHIDGSWREADAVRIPGYAISDHLAEAGHAEAPPYPPGVIPNSGNETSSFAVGGSWVGTRGFVGLSASQLNKDYGIPPGSHQRSADEQDHDEVEPEHGHGDGLLGVDLHQSRYALRTRVEAGRWLDHIDAHLAYDDYQHIEYARDLQRPDQDGSEHHRGHDHEHDHEADGHSTRFTKRGTAARVSAERSANSHGAQWRTNFGLQLDDSTFSVRGDHGFLPRIDTETTALFVVQSLDLGDWLWEYGGRIEHAELTPDGGCARRDTSWSASAAARWQVRDHLSLHFGSGRSARAAGAQERYANVRPTTCAPVAPENRKLHAPTGLIELGDPNLSEEVSHNVEVGFVSRLGALRAEAMIYSMSANNYVYLAGTGHASAEYRQQDAEFRGYEAALTLPVQVSPSRRLEANLFADAVRAQLASGEKLPRIPPRRFGVALALVDQHWSLGMKATRIAKADRLAPGETPTGAYTLVRLNADYHMHLGRNELVLFAAVNNALDESIRQHASFVKDFAPEPGRGVALGVRGSF